MMEIVVFSGALTRKEQARLRCTAQSDIRPTIGHPFMCIECDDWCPPTRRSCRYCQPVIQASVLHKLGFPGCSVRKAPVFNKGTKRLVRLNDVLSHMKAHPADVFLEMMRRRTRKVEGMRTLALMNYSNAKVSRMLSSHLT